MSPMKRYATKQAKARKRRRLKAQARLKHQRAQAQHYIEALHQALKDLDFPATLVAEIEGRLRAQQKLLGKIVALMFPTLFGCRHGHELTRVRGWNKNIPSQLLGALPKRSWLKRLRRLGLEMLVSIWRHTQDKSAATQSRWQWRWIVDDSVFRKYGKQFGLVGTWYSGQFKHTVPGIDGVLLLVVIGDGKRIIPVDFALRRPNPKGPGRRCQEKLVLTQHMLDERLAAFAKRGVTLPAPMVVADSWFSDSKLMRYVANAYRGTLLVQGKCSYTFTLEDGHKVKGADVVNPAQWSWQQSLHAPGCRFPFHQRIHQQWQGPGRAPLRRLAARQGHETRFLRPVEFAWLRVGRRLAGQGSLESDLDQPLAPPMNGRHADLERVSDLPVTPVGAIDVGLQQHPCPQGLVSGHTRP